MGGPARLYQTEKRATGPPPDPGGREAARESGGAGLSALCRLKKSGYLVPATRTSTERELRMHPGLGGAGAYPDIRLGRGKESALVGHRECP